MTAVACAQACTVGLTVAGAWSCGGGDRDGVGMVALGDICRGVPWRRVFLCQESLDASDRRLVRKAVRARARDKVEYKVASSC